RGLVEDSGPRHCNLYAVRGCDADASLLARAGAQVTRLADCCGLAGNFGMEKGHYDVSVQVAEAALLPALRESGPESVYLADGYSCRTQAEQLAGRTGVHLAQLLTPPAPDPTPRRPRGDGGALGEGGEAVGVR